jgi:hypothetical protein
MKTLLLILITSLSPLLTIAQEMREVKLLTTSAKKVITRGADNYSILIDNNDFINSIDKVSSKVTKMVVSSGDRKALKDYLKKHFSEQDTLNSTNNLIPDNLQQAFTLIFMDYLNVALSKGNYSVYNSALKSYEKNIFIQIEEKIGDNVVMGIKVKDSVKVINVVTTYYASDKTSEIYMFTDTRTEKK